jgi:hypothetical protein
VVDLLLEKDKNLLQKDLISRRKRIANRKLENDKICDLTELTEY